MSKAKADREKHHNTEDTLVLKGRIVSTGGHMNTPANDQYIKEMEERLDFLLTEDEDTDGK